MSLKIGKINIKNAVLLAPMAGVTDLPFRIICKEMGADLVYTEFVSSNGIIRENKKTLDLIKFVDEDKSKLGLKHLNYSIKNITSISDKKGNLFLPFAPSKAKKIHSRLKKIYKFKYIYPKLGT